MSDKELESFNKLFNKYELLCFSMILGKHLKLVNPVVASVPFLGPRQTV